MAPKICTILPYFFQLLDRTEVCKFLVPYDFAKSDLKEMAFMCDLSHLTLLKRKKNSTEKINGINSGKCHDSPFGLRRVKLLLFVSTFVRFDAHWMKLHFAELGQNESNR